MFPFFLRSLAEKWCLPWIAPCMHSRDECWLTTKLPTTLDDIPPFPDNPREFRWGSPTRRLWIQTDNQQVEMAFAGLSVLDDDLLRPACVRIGRRIEALLRLDVRPRVDAEPFVEWDRRELNTMADHAANIVLDHGQNWGRVETENLHAFSFANSNFRLCVDGALRGNGASSAGIAIWAYNPEKGRVLLFRAGRLLNTQRSSFASEIMALEWGLDELARLCQ